MEKLRISPKFRKSDQ